MRISQWVGTLALVSTAWLAGCERSTTSMPGEANVEALPKFSVKKGLLLPEQTRRSLGLTVVEATEQKLVSTLTVDLRIYRKDGSGAFASGIVSPELAKALKTARTLTVRLPDGTRQAAAVTGTAQDLQQRSSLTEVLVMIPSPADVFAPGAFVQASAIVQTSENTLTIPRAALLGCSDGMFVYTVNGDHLVRTPVKTGAGNEELVEIADGLYAGDQVVLHPVLSLWMTELAAVKGGQACCIEPPKGK